MRNPSLAIVILCVLATASVSNAQPGQVVSSRKYDNFTEYNCEDLMARLDNYAMALQLEPNLKGYIVSYGGSYGQPEARVWAYEARKYLTSNRGIAARRIVTLYGGKLDRRTLELWLLLDSYRPSAAGTSQPKGVKFKNSRVRNRQCSFFF